MRSTPFLIKRSRRSLGFAAFVSSVFQVRRHKKTIDQSGGKVSFIYLNIIRRTVSRTMDVRQWNCERNQSNFGPRDIRRPIRSVDRRIPFLERSKVHWTWNNNKVVKCWRELVRGWFCSIIIKPWSTPSLYSTLHCTAFDSQRFPTLRDARRALVVVLVVVIAEAVIKRAGKNWRKCTRRARGNQEKQVETFIVERHDRATASGKGPFFFFFFVYSAQLFFYTANNLW